MGYLEIVQEDDNKLHFIIKPGFRNWILFFGFFSIGASLTLLSECCCWQIIYVSGSLFIASTFIGNWQETIVNKNTQQFQHNMQNVLQKVLLRNKFITNDIADFKDLQQIKCNVLNCTLVLYFNNTIINIYAESSEICGILEPKLCAFLNKPKSSDYIDSNENNIEEEEEYDQSGSETDQTQSDTEETNSEESEQVGLESEQICEKVSASSSTDDFEKINKDDLDDFEERSKSVEISKLIEKSNSNVSKGEVSLNNLENQHNLDINNLKNSLEKGDIVESINLIKQDPVLVDGKTEIIKKDAGELNEELIARNVGSGDACLENITAMDLHHGLLDSNILDITENNFDSDKNNEINKEQAICKNIDKVLESSNEKIEDCILNRLNARDNLSSDNNSEIDKNHIPLSQPK